MVEAYNNFVVEYTFVGFQVLVNLNICTKRTHVCLFASSVKIITKRIAIVFLLPIQVSQDDFMLRLICVFLGCDMPIQLVLSSEYDDRMEDHFIMYGFTSRTTKYVTFMLEQMDLRIFLPVIYQFSFFFVLTSA